MSKNQKIQACLYRIDRTLGKIVSGDVYCMIGLAVLAGIYAILVRWGVIFCASNTWQTAFIIYKHAWLACGIVACSCIIGRIGLSPFVKSEEQEEFEQKIEYVLQQKKFIQQQPEAMNYTPLCNLSDKQEMVIRQVLHDLPSHSNKPDTINLALVAQYLTALEQMGKAKLTDMHNLRLWVARTTGKTVPSASQFNEAIPSKAASKISKARKELERLI